MQSEICTNMMIENYRNYILDSAECLTFQDKFLEILLKCVCVCVNAACLIPSNIMAVHFYLFSPYSFDLCGSFATIHKSDLSGYTVWINKYMLSFKSIKGDSPVWNEVKTDSWTDKWLIGMFLFVEIREAGLKLWMGHSQCKVKIVKLAATIAEFQLPPAL